MGEMGTLTLGWALYKLGIFVAGSFVFSIIFWLTYDRMITAEKDFAKKKGKRK